MLHEKSSTEAVHSSSSSAHNHNPGSSPISKPAVQPLQQVPVEKQPEDGGLLQRAPGIRPFQLKPDELKNGITPGREQRLPHKTWQVVQQKQGGGRQLQPVIQRVIYKLVRGSWVAIEEKEKKGDHPLPKGVADNTWFNDVTGVSGGTRDEVIGNSPYGNETAPSFEKLLKISDDDDNLEHSRIDISWKQDVIKYRNNEEQLQVLLQKIPEAWHLKEDDEAPQPKHGHGEIGTFAINNDEETEQRLHQEPKLFSKDFRVRKKAVEVMRGSDEVYSAYQGPILRRFIYEERKAILGLIREARGAAAIFSLERGGSMIADLIERLSRGIIRPEQNIKIAKPSEEEVALHLEQPAEEKSSGRKTTTKRPTKRTVEKPVEGSKQLETAANQKQVHAEKFKHAILKFIQEQQQPEITIAITETAVGGGSVNSMVKTVTELCDTLKGGKVRVHFKILVARETIKNTNYQGAGILKLHDPDNIQRNEGIHPMRELETGNPNEVQVFISQTRYLIGEDVGYQLRYTGGVNAKKPVIVFEGSGNNLTALCIEPASADDTAREVIIDLIAGAYDRLMTEIFPAHL